MSIDGWLVLDIALGIVVGDWLRNMLKATQRWLNRPRAGSAKAEAEDWDFLWSNLPESGKDELRKIVEDDVLRRRAQELSLWHDLWHVAPEEAKQQLRHRWKAAKIPPRVSG